MRQRLVNRSGVIAAAALACGAAAAAREPQQAEGGNNQQLHAGGFGSDPGPPLAAWLPRGAARLSAAAHGLLDALAPGLLGAPSPPPQQLLGFAAAAAAPGDAAPPLPSFWPAGLGRGGRGGGGRGGGDAAPRWVPAAELAAAHPGTVAAMRGWLAARGVRLRPAWRFTDAELMRYAVTHGFLRARTPGAAAAAAEEGAAAAARTARWLQVHDFLPESELSRFAHLIWWGDDELADGELPGRDGGSGGTSSSGGDGNKGARRPVLHIAVGRAVCECRGAAALEFAEAIVTHVELARRRRLGDGAAAGGLPEQVDVRMDARGVTALSASRLARVAAGVAATLNAHYPGRLHALALAELPPVLTWLVAATKALLHRETRGKIRLVRAGEDFGGGVDGRR